MSRNTNEEFLSVLSQYDGSVDDRRKKYLQDTYGFSSNSALPSMEYQVLGDLGYTGSIDDRWSKYLKALGGTGLSSKAELLSSTFYGFYSANSLSPEFVLDFERETYLTDSTSSTFSEALTFTATGNRTMVDSDGVLKWAPHNLLAYSEQFDNADWSTLAGGIPQATVTSNAGVAPDGTTTASRVQDIGSGLLYQFINLTAGVTYSLSIWVKSYDGSDQVFQLYGDSQASATSDFTATSKWQLYTLTFTANTTASKGNGLRDGSSGDDFDILVWGAHFYRSDLGGMVNNPDRGDSYVPTTDSAVFLPRRGHHVYDGSAWVNKGLLLESESRTNLEPYSNDFTNWINQSSTDAATDNNYTTITPTGASSAVRNGGETVSGLTTYTTSIEARQNGAAFCYVQFNSGGGTTRANAVYLDFSDGSVSIVDEAGGGFSSKASHVEQTGPSSYRFGLTVTTDVDHNSLQIFTGAAAAVGTKTASPADTVDIRHAQFEEASTPSSYIPTSGSTVTRAGETLTAPSDNLPWPEPVVIGEQRVTNGGFDTDSDWTKGTGWTISGGAANKAAGTGDAITQANVSMAEGALYAVSYTVSGSTTGVCAAILTADTQVTGSLVSGNGDRVEYLKGTAGVDGYGVTANATFDGSIDNVSVREINPLALSIQMDGRMTYADTNTADEVLQARWENTSNEKIDLVISTTGVRTGEQFFTQISSGVPDFVGSGATTYSPGVNVPFSIASRHGSTFINGAVDGTALTANTTPTALPDLSSTDLEIGPDFMGTIKSIRIWADDIGDDGIEEASS